MQTASGHEVDWSAEQLLYAVFQTQQFNRTEARIIEVEEQVDVTVGPCLVAANGPEEEQVRHAIGAKFGRVIAQSGQHRASFHRLLLRHHVAHPIGSGRSRCGSVFSESVVSKSRSTASSAIST